MKQTKLKTEMEKWNESEHEKQTPKNKNEQKTKEAINVY